MATRQYVGARYVPKFFSGISGTSSDWVRGVSYEALTVVTYLGNSYTSKKPVPADIEITNTEYWALTGNYNAQVERYRQETERVSESLNSRAIHELTVSSMKQNSNLIDGDVVFTSGYYTVNDGGSAKYQIITTNTGKCEALNNGLYAQLQIETFVCPEMFGARGTGAVDDSEAFQACVDYALEHKIKMYADRKYLLNSTINIHGLRVSSVVTKGSDAYLDFSGATFTYTGVDYAFDCTMLTYSYINFGSITASSGSCILLHSNSNTTHIQYCKFTANLLSAFNECVKIYNGTTGSSKGWNNENIFFGGKFNTGHYGFYVESTNSNKINGWYFYNNGIEGVDCGYYLEAKTEDDYTVGYITDVNINNPRTREIHDESGQKLLVTKGRVVNVILTALESVSTSYFEFLQDDGSTLPNHIAEDIVINCPTNTYVVRQGMIVPLSVSHMDRFTKMASGVSDDDILAGNWRASDDTYALKVEVTNGYPFRTGNTAYLKQNKSFRNGREVYRFSEGGTTFGEWYSRPFGCTRVVSADDMNTGTTITLPNFDCDVTLKLYHSNGTNAEEFICKTGSGNTFAKQIYMSGDSAKYAVTVSGRNITIQSTSSETVNTYVVANVIPIVLN